MKEIPPLTEKQKRFCYNYYYEPKTKGHPVDSYIAAYGCSYSTARAHAAELLKKRQIVAELAAYEQAERVAISAEIRANTDIVKIPRLMQLLSVMAENKEGEYSHALQLKAIVELGKMQGAFRENVGEKTADVKIIVNAPSQQNINNYEAFKKERDVIEVESHELGE